MSATFHPESSLAEEMAYTVTLTAGILDVAGNPMVPFSSWFSTTDVRPGSIVYAAHRVDDGPAHDGTGDDSVGNNDGAAQCGETIELYLTVRNEGTFALSGLSGRITESDPYTVVLFNNNSPFPELAVGDSGEKTADWDLGIAAHTPQAYDLTVTITFFLLDSETLTLRPANNALDVVIPVECPPPTVKSIDPADDAVDAPVEGSVYVNFSRPVDPATITPDTFLLSDGAPVPGTITVIGDGTGAKFDPDADLAHSTAYSVTLTSGISDTEGNQLVEFVSAFTTEEPDLTSPKVVAVSPSHGAESVGVESNVTVTFSEPVDPATVTTGTFQINDGSVIGAVSVFGDGTKVTFAPDADLHPNTTYSLKLTNGIADPAGNPLVPFGSSFTTGDPTPEAGVPLVVSYRVDDGPSHDGTANDSKGNNDLTGIRATLGESDPYVRLLYNTSSAYPNLPVGASVENPRDWDFEVDADTPNGHKFTFTLTFTADSGGPWETTVQVPIGCEA